MKKITGFLVILMFFLLVGAGCADNTNNQPNDNQNITNTPDNTNPPNDNDMIKVTSPLSNETVSSPLVVKGEAKGDWFFEGSFPVRLLNSEGEEIALTIAEAKSEWMTTNFVPFETTIIFDPGSSVTGTLVLQKDNPSGLPENDQEIKIPIKFNQNNQTQKTVSLFYYNPEKDKDSTGNLMCSKLGLVEVKRNIIVSITPIQDTIKLLLKGQLTTTEKNNGITTEYPLPGVELKGANLKDGVLTLEISDPQGKTSGGSCRSGILWSQIEATAKQFPEVKSVKFIPEDIFQP